MPNLNAKGNSYIKQSAQSLMQLCSLVYLAAKAITVPSWVNAHFHQELNSSQCAVTQCVSQIICTGIEVDQFLECIERLTDWMDFKAF